MLDVPSEVANQPRSPASDKARHRQARKRKALNKRLRLALGGTAAAYLAVHAGILPETYTPTIHLADLFEGAHAVALAGLLGLTLVLSARRWIVSSIRSGFLRVVHLVVEQVLAAIDRRGTVDKPVQKRSRPRPAGR